MTKSLKKKQKGGDLINIITATSIGAAILWSINKLNKNTQRNKSSRNKSSRNKSSRNKSSINKSSRNKSSRNKPHLQDLDTNSETDKLDKNDSPQSYENNEKVKTKSPIDKKLIAKIKNAERLEIKKRANQRLKRARTASF
jgi:hypothetical protein